MNQELRAEVVGVAVECATCGRMKKPVGRSAPMGLLMCDDQCAGFWQPPRSGSLWPGESEADFGYPVGDEGTSAEGKATS